MRCSLTAATASRADTAAVPLRRRAATAPLHERRQGLLHRTTVAAAINEDSSPSSSTQRKRLAVFVSGGGSNLRAIHAATLDGRVDADVVVVVSDVPGCGGWSWAQERGIETRCFPPLETRGAGKAALRERAAEELAGELLLPFDADADSEARRGSSHSASSTASGGLGVDVVALAGYLKLIPPPLVRAFPRRMLNIHPALLPGPFGGKGFYGIKVHEAVLASGARFSGPTVHFVDEVFDRGPILAQRAVPVLYPKDDAAALAKRVLAAEHEVFPEALGALCSGRVRWTERGIPYY